MHQEMFPYSNVLHQKLNKADNPNYACTNIYLGANIPVRVVRFVRFHLMSSETKSEPQTTTGADAIDRAIAAGVDFDGSPIPPAKLELYQQVMALEAGRQRSGVTNTMRSRIVRIGAKHIPQQELNQMLIDAGFVPLKDKEIAFYYSSK